MRAPIALSPGPHEAPEVHQSIQVGDMRFPSNAHEGSVKVMVVTGAELDQQKANGKGVARTKVKGKKIAKVSLAFRFSRRIYDDGNAFRIAIDPGGDNNGRAWEAGHPELSDRRVNNLMFTNMGALEPTGDSYTFTAEADGWNEPEAAKVGGTTTPKVAKPTPTAASIASQFDAFAVTLGAASDRAVAANNAAGISAAAEALRRAAAGQDPNPPFDGPKV